MASKNGYNELMNEAFESYYEAFRKHGALSKETALTLDEIFPAVELSFSDKEIIRKLKNYGFIKKAGNKYYLDEEKLNKPGGILAQKLLLLFICAVFVMVYVMFADKFI
ncbi:MAG: hypothetical protein Q4B86_01275 [Eubacteriales bacterium]|nr:hypothetical protein [Eubacteriales bacterium]